MNHNILLIASSLFFIQPVRQTVRAIDTQYNQRYSSINGKAFQLIYFFLEPASIGSAIDAGYDLELIESALYFGIITHYEDYFLSSKKTWEEYKWSRAAYLMFSQLDIDYVEPVEKFEKLQDISEFRRKSIQDYTVKGSYPPYRLVSDNSPIDLLSVPDNQPIDLDSLVQRRSVRSFSKTPISLTKFSAIIFESTRNVRLAEKSKEDEDLYFILNSFYSWLNVYIAVQGVEGIHRGIYQYNPLKHQLHQVSQGFCDKDIAECIQNQNWIGGGGFCLFVVVQWERYMWIYRHSRAYINLLIQLGEFGQEVLQTTYHCGLGAWMTPAITERKAHEILKLDPMHQDAMYFLKIGLGNE